MLSEQESLPVSIRSERNSQTSKGEILIQFWNKKERTKRALKFGGMCWGFAIVCVFIPLLHFILVPGFLIAGPIVAFVVLSRESAILGGKGLCPYCNAALPIARAPYRFPISDLCTQCQSSLKIEPAHPPVPV